MIQDWRRMLIKRDWTHNRAEVEVSETAEQPLKVMFLAMMTHRGLSDLHIVPPEPDRSGKVPRGFQNSARRRSNSSRSEHSRMVQDHRPGVPGEGRVAGQQVSDVTTRYVPARVGDVTVSSLASGAC